MSEPRWVDALFPDEPQWARDLVDDALASRDAQIVTLSTTLAEAKQRLASIIALCGQEGCDGEPYDTFYRVATGEFDPHVRYPREGEQCG